MNAQERAAEAGVEPTAHIKCTPDGHPRAFEFRHWCYAFDEWGVVDNVLSLSTDSYGWTLVSADPITITPSVWCHGCDSHGFVTDGQWVWV